jgi:potassium-transporting ATPase KdpC subunit
MNWYKESFAALRLLWGLTVVTGIAYPLIITGLAQIWFPATANGSLIYQQIGTGKKLLVGSALIGQRFISDRYFHSRLSASDYDGLASGGSNFGPTSQRLRQQVATTVKQSHPLPTCLIPVDLVTTSASGLDPDISPAAAAFQVARVARSRQLSLEVVRNLVQQHTSTPQWGLLGEYRVNVLNLNMALDAMAAPSNSRLSN